MIIPSGIICYWQYNPQANLNRGESQWNFLEAYAVDQDGHPKTTPINGGYRQFDYQSWANESPGRAVTFWNVEDGVTLLEINLPDLPKWLTRDFVKKVIKAKNWPSFFEDGYALWAGTARQIEKMLEK